jgi:hypothetical protein
MGINYPINTVLSHFNCYRLVTFELKKIINIFGFSKKLTIFVKQKEILECKQIQYQSLGSYNQ